MSDRKTDTKMTEPVNTGELRAITRDRDDVLAAWEVDAICAAADEVDRLRADVEASAKMHEQARVLADSALKQRDALRAAIEDAPHDRDCDSLEESSLGDVWESGRPCTCWKATAL